MTAIKKKAHSFIFRVAFTRPLTRKEAMEAIRNTGQFGPGANDYFSIYRAGPYPQEMDPIDGEMKVSSIKHYTVPA